jgi:flagellar hook-length control protein FliK
VLPGKLLKQESIVALLDAKQKLMSAQVAKNAHQDEKIQSTENAASADAQTTSITVQSQEAHWIFDRTGSTSNPRISGSLVEAVSQLKPANPTGATTELVAKGDEKTQAQPGTQIQASAVVAPDDAKLRQAFDGQQQSAGNGRDQAPAGTPGEKHVVDVKTAVPSEHVSPDGSHLPGSLSGATLQVRTGIVNVLKGDSPGAPAATATQLPQDRPAMATQVLRTIDLTLSPPDLGTVRLKLSLTSNALDINAEASKASTAKLLDDDRKGLEQSLRDAGYDVKSVKIAELSASGNSSLNNSLSGGSSFQDGSQTRANFSGRQDGNMQRRDGAMPDQQPQQRQPRDDGRRASTASDLGSGRQSNAIYI